MFTFLRAPPARIAVLGTGAHYEVLAVQGFNAYEDVVLFQLGRVMEGKVELPSSLPAVTLGSPAAANVGDRVASIGSPKGLSNTVSDGLVSNIREEGGRRLIQTMAPILPGSSGAPLFNTNAWVIGLTALEMREGQNLNFAVAIKCVANLLQRCEELPLPDFKAELAAPASGGSSGFRCSSGSHCEGGLEFLIEDTHIVAILQRPA